ncbi:MAG: RNA-binding transcriptional accessory protein [Deltaproteobacteria bacterium]|nr:RNA-binding transcriptional accessory protein [Deltaproteobacteria bacterium]
MENPQQDPGVERQAKDRNILRISEELGVRPEQVAATVGLLFEGATVPFIARYRKEATGSLDEVAVAAVRDRLAQMEELDRRRESILKSLQERNLLSDELKEKVQAAESMSVLEDLYLPYRPKRRTRATIAREKDLEPLAAKIFTQDEQMDLLKEAAAFVSPDKSVDSVEDAIAGAGDIMAEWVAENQAAREKTRALFIEKGVFSARVVKGKETVGSKYRDYFDWQETVTAVPSHRMLAVRRGEKEGFLNLRVSPPEEEAMVILETLFVKGKSLASQVVKEAVEDGYKRLLAPSMETETRTFAKDRADEEAIKVFAGNLRELLLAPPLGQKRVIAIDPGIRTGCKVVCLDRQGKLLHKESIFPFDSAKRRSEAEETFLALCRGYDPEAVAVGNGTAGRETEAFVEGLPMPGNIPVIMVNESGASVYSASEAGRREFPDLDLTYRGAVSIGRRLMDPLAELVKIDPKSIGVGQYQHDVNQYDLKKSLDDVVTSCVNAVGVEVNTASEEILTYVSGLGPQLARNILLYRNEKGPFPSLESLKKVPRLGPKAFEQAAGFLRIRNGINLLDASAVHPESYPVVEAMARDLDCTVEDLLKDVSLREKIDAQRYVTEKVGMPTLKDILAELARPGRDPRKQFENVKFAEGVKSISDLRPGLTLQGIVTNVAAFGAFVDVGVHQDGLVHVSELSDGYVKNPHTVVKINQSVTVRILDVDLERNRISLSMKKAGSRPKKKVVKKAEKAKAERSRDKPNPFNNPFVKAFR